MDIVIVILLLILLAEATYLVANSTRKLIGSAGGRPIFVDTSVLIDGRIVAVAESGFINGILYVPRSVVGELQFLADNADHEKRSRARYGLDVIQELQHMKTVTTKIYQDGSRAREGVDERLLKLAAKHHGAVCTIDYNLNKVAQVEGVMVLNINELAQKLRMSYLPGERMRLELAQKGQDGHQAVGHLEDGTMVVVEQASQFIGSTLEVEFIRSLQTAAGRMLFAKLTEKPHTPKPKQKQSAPASKAKRAVKKSTPRATRTRRPSHEESLIELVNSQE